MTNEEFDALIAAERTCPDELFEARKKLFELEQNFHKLNEIYYICDRYGYDADKISYVLKGFYCQTSDRIVEVLRDLDLIRQSLELKIKTLEEHAL